MGRILAIDYGKKRVGVAVTDPLQIIAQALETVETPKLMPFLKEYTAKNDVDAFVVGMPKQMDNTPSESYSFVEPFVARLKKEFPGTPVVMVDERFTSKMAFRIMIDAGVKKHDRRDKGTVDRISAVLILQTYLEGRGR